MAQFAADSFTGVDGTTLQVHSANWVEHTLSAGGDMLITANRLQQRVSGEGFYYHSASPASADYSVSADFYVASYSPAFNATGVIGRTSTTANTFYHARHRISGGWELYKRVTGTFTLLGSQTVSTPAALGTYNLKLDMVGSTIRLLADGVELVSAVDTSITAAGKSGLRISNASAQTSAEGLHFDNFSADGAGAGAVSVLAAGISTAEMIGSPAVVITVNGSGITTAETVGVPTVSVVAPAEITGTGQIATAEALGSPELKVSITAADVASTEAFGNAGLVLGIDVAGLTSAEAVGTPEVGGVAPAEITGVGQVAAAEALGSPALVISISTAGTESTEAFGLAALSAVIANAGSIATAETVGAPAVTEAGPAEITGVGGIASATAFGSVSVGAMVPYTGTSFQIGSGYRRPPRARREQEIALPHRIGAAGIESRERLGYPALKWRGRSRKVRDEEFLLGRAA